MVAVPVILLSAAFLNFGKNSKRIQLYVDGESIKITTNKETVDALLEEQRVVLRPGDDIHPPPKTYLSDKQVILLTRGINTLNTTEFKQAAEIETTASFVEKKIPIPFKVVKKNNQRLARGRERRLVKGKDGLVLVGYKVFFIGGQEIKRKIVSQYILVPPKNEVVSIGTGAALYASRNNNTPRASANDIDIDALSGDTVTMTATAYWRMVSGTGITSTGRKAGYGIVAVDPRVIPLGTRVYVDGYGYAIAADTGKAIKGKKIDLCFNTHAEAKRFGRRTLAVKIIR